MSRKNLNTSSLSEQKLGVASSCDLKFFVEHLKSQMLFKNIRYNFDEGSSDDAYIEMLRTDSFLTSSDVIIASIAETSKKLIHLLVAPKEKWDANEAFYNLEYRLRELVAYLMKTTAKAIFIFKYPINRYSSDINDRPWIEGGLTFWLDKLDRLYVDILSNCDNRIDLIDLDEALISTGYSSSHFRKELHGGHPEKLGAILMADLFIERLVSRIDLTNKIKVIALDLDNTLWEGVFVDSNFASNFFLTRLQVLCLHAQKGIPIVVVSKNNPEDIPKIKEIIKRRSPALFNAIIDYKVSWSPKSQSIKKISTELGVGINSIAFFDDNEFERREVEFNCPDVRIYQETDLDNSLRYAEFSFARLSGDAKKRIKSYKENIIRAEADKAESQSFTNINDYLASLAFQINFRKSELDDLDRIEELVQRTNQQNLLLNRSNRERCLYYIKSGFSFIIGLKDKFGDYGIIGVCFFEPTFSERIELKELAISCRALGKGVEDSIAAYLVHKFNQYKILSFKAVVNYKNQSFFEKLISLGFRFNEANALMYALLPSPIKYPAWFNVEDNFILNQTLSINNNPEPYIRAKKVSFMNQRLHIEGISILRGIPCASYGDIILFLILVNEHRSYEISLAKGNRAELTKLLYDGENEIDYSKGWFCSHAYRGLDVSHISEGAYSMSIAITCKKITRIEDIQTDVDFSTDDQFLDKSYSIRTANNRLVFEVATT